jgi:hypothetical protein
MISVEQLQSHAERIRASGALGRSELLLRLFNFFVECSLVQRVPKEIEVALDVFGKKADFDVAQDAVVRVYIHKLRRKMDEYYAGPGKDDPARLIIPKGEYRFLLQDHAEPLPVAEPEPEDPALTRAAEVELEALVASAAARSHSRRWLPWLVGAAGLLLLVNLLLMWLRPATQRDADALQSVRSNPVWARMLDDNLPIYIVVGDYYIFGELDDTSMQVRRLVREFDINSPNDLEQNLKNNPDLAGRYMDMSLQYLPISAAFALRNVMPLLEPNNKSARQVQVILASDLTPAMVKSAHIIYIGLLSGMGVLHEIVFSGSHFKIGESYDELLDLQTRKRYVSEASVQPDARASYLDYGFFSTRTGADGNELVILAGTRDVALMHVAEMLTAPRSLTQLDAQAGATQDFEALYSVQALDRTNLGGKLLLTYRFDQQEFVNTTSSAAH